MRVRAGLEYITFATVISLLTQRLLFCQHFVFRDAQDDLEWPSFSYQISVDRYSSLGQYLELYSFLLGLYISLQKADSCWSFLHTFLLIGILSSFYDWTLRSGNIITYHIFVAVQYQFSVIHFLNAKIIIQLRIERHHILE